VNYQPRIKDAKPIIEEKKLRFGTQKFYKVVEVISEKELLLGSCQDSHFLRGL